MATLYNVPTQNSLQYTLDSQLAAEGTSLTLNQSVAGIVQAPGVGWIDRVDSSGNATASKREYFSFTGVSGANLTGLVRGLAGSTDQVHAVGAIVEFGPDVVQEQATYNVITTEHNTSGLHTGITGSTASLNGVNTRFLAISSLASIRQIFASDALNASGASLQGFHLRPTWFLGGVLSGASANLGAPVSMPHGAKIQYAYVMTRIGSSSASLGFDIKVNGTSVIAGSNVLSIPVNGTYVSTASITTQNFVGGDAMTVGTLNAGSLAQDATIVVVAR